MKLNYSGFNLSIRARILLYIFLCGFALVYWAIIKATFLEVLVQAICVSVTFVLLFPEWFKKKGGKH